jgi:hypothetical protein
MTIRYEHNQVLVILLLLSLRTLERSQAAVHRRQRTPAAPSLVEHHFCRPSSLRDFVETAAKTRAFVSVGCGTLGVVPRNIRARDTLLIAFKYQLAGDVAGSLRNNPARPGLCSARRQLQLSRCQKSSNFAGWSVPAACPQTVMRYSISQSKIPRRILFKEMNGPHDL